MQGFVGQYQGQELGEDDNYLGKICGDEDFAQCVEADRIVLNSLSERQREQRFDGLANFEKVCQK